MEITDRRPAPSPDHGFTLIEVLVAIVVSGVLAAVVVVGVSAMTGKGSSSACRASLDAAAAAAVSYFAEHRSFPLTIQPMVDGGQLEVADGVAVTSPTTAAGSGWTLTMVPIDSTTKPGFICS